MKTLYEIINQPPIFLHDWTYAADVIADFQYGGASSLDVQEDDNILFASYGTDNWSGDAFVLYENHGVLYEVNGNHCSCYGLEGQWEREEVTPEVLKHRLLNGEFGHDDYSGNEFHDELCEFLGIE